MPPSLEPRLVDHGGYAVSASDLAFLDVAFEDYDAFHARSRPLGTTETSFKYFALSLTDALRACRVQQADVRLQGSSANFFSNRHKPFPWSRHELIELYGVLQDRVPQPFELNEVMERLDETWPSRFARPASRMFDLLHQLGIDLQKSDIDVQISSDELVHKARSRLRDLGLAESELRTNSPKYGFVKKYLVKDVAPQLDLWADEQSLILGRRVSVAVFSTSGPPRADSTDELSSHHRPDDWILTLSMPGSVAS